MNGYSVIMLIVFIRMIKGVIMKNIIAMIIRILLGMILLFPVTCICVFFACIITIATHIFNLFDKLNNKIIDFIWFIVNKINE